MNKEFTLNELVYLLTISHIIIMTTTLHVNNAVNIFTSPIQSV